MKFIDMGSIDRTKRKLLFIKYQSIVVKEE
jgi:hypothetical protein